MQYSCSIYGLKSIDIYAYAGITLKADMFSFVRLGGLLLSPTVVVGRYTEKSTNMPQTSRMTSDLGLLDLYIFMSNK